MGDATEPSGIEVEAIRATLVAMFRAAAIAFLFWLPLEEIRGELRRLVNDDDTWSALEAQIPMLKAAAEAAEAAAAAKREPLD